MAKFTVTGFTFILNILAALTQDITHNLYCNKNSKTWNDAWADCRKANGSLVPYLNVDNIHLNNEADVWTADYAKQPPQWNKYERVCGFHFVSQNKQYSEVMFGDCYAQRHYLCKNNITNALDVLTAARDNVRCPDVISNVELNGDWHNFIPGYYWLNDILYVSTDTATQQIPYQSSVLCGAYTPGIGKYFVDCYKHRSSLCQMNISNDMIFRLFDKSCFDHRLKTTSSTNQITTTSANLHTVTAYNATRAAGAGSTEKRTDNNSNIGLTVGLPVGLCIVTICGITLSIFMFRRYKCWKTWRGKSDPSEEASRNNVSPKRQGLAHDNNYYIDNSSVHVFDRTGPNDEPVRTNDKLFKTSIPEYAVVQKNDFKHKAHGHKETSPSKEKKNEPAHTSDLDGNNSYCYAKFRNTDNVNQFAKSNEIQTSEYSFARETTEDMDDNKDKHANVTEDEYDITSKVPSYKTDNNIYNHLQTKDYGASTQEERDGNSLNVYNISQNQTSETVYDSTKQIERSEPTDRIYNQMFQTEMYSDFSTGKEDRSKQMKQTDQTYSKLK